MNLSKPFLNPFILLASRTSCGNEFPNVVMCCVIVFPFVSLNSLPGKSKECCLVHVMKSAEHTFFIHFLIIEKFLNLFCNTSVVSFCSYGCKLSVYGLYSHFSYGSWSIWQGFFWPSELFLVSLYLCTSQLTMRWTHLFCLWSHLLHASSKLKNQNVQFLSLSS